MKQLRLSIWYACTVWSFTLCCMDTQQRNPRALKSIENTADLIHTFNRKNMGEVAINTTNYLQWLQSTELHLSGSDRNKTIILEMAKFWAAHNLAYTQHDLKPLWSTLSNQYSELRLNSLLYTLSCQGEHSYITSHQHTYKRFLIAALIYAGANVNQPNNQLLRPLGEAVLMDDTAAVKLLLKLGADPNTIMMQKLQAPLIWYAPSEPTIKLLVKHGARLTEVTTASECDSERYEELAALYKKYEK